VNVTIWRGGAEVKAKGEEDVKAKAAAQAKNAAQTQAEAEGNATLVEKATPHFEEAQRTFFES